MVSFGRHQLITYKVKIVLNALTIDNPALGQVGVSNELKKKEGGVRSIWFRYTYRHSNCD